LHLKKNAKIFKKYIFNVAQPLIGRFVILDYFTYRYCFCIYKFAKKDLANARMINKMINKTKKENKRRRKAF